MKEEDGKAIWRSRQAWTSVVLRGQPRAVNIVVNCGNGGPLTVVVPGFK